MSGKGWKIHRSAQQRNFSTSISPLSHCEDRIKLQDKSIKLAIFTLDSSFESWAALHIHSYLEQSPPPDTASAWDSVRDSANPPNLHTYWVERMGGYRQLLGNIPTRGSLLNE